MAIDDLSGARAHEVCGGWAKVAVELAGVLAELHGIPGAGAVARLLDSLVDTQCSQDSVLRSIKADTSALRNEHFLSGLNRLGDARHAGPAHPMWEVYLTSAEEHLSSARSLVRDATEEMLVEFNLSMVLLMRGHRDQAARHLGQSSQAADRALGEYLQAQWWDYSGAGNDGSSPMQVITDMRPDFPHAPPRRTGPFWDGISLMWALSGIFSGGLTLLFGLLYVLERKRRLFGQLERFIWLYNVNEYAASSITGRSARYRALTIKQGALGPKYATLR